MTSSAELGRGFVSLEFQVGFDTSRALQEVANRLDEVPSYPDDVDRPVIRASDSASDDAVAYCLLQAEDPDYEAAQFYDYADRYLKPRWSEFPAWPRSASTAAASTRCRCSSTRWRWPSGGSALPSCALRCSWTTSTNRRATWATAARTCGSA